MFQPEVMLAVVDRTIKKNKLLGDLLSAEQIKSLAQNSLLRPVETGEVLCRQHQNDRTLYLIVEGDCEISVGGKSGVKSLGKLGAGDIFGELAGLFMMPRIATVTVIRPSVIVEIPCEIFSEILAENSYLHSAFVNRCKHRVIETALRCVPIFENLDKASFNELSYLAMLIHVDKDAIVAQEGAVERRMYVVSHGTARVYIAAGGREMTIALLRPGDYFGEYSLFTGEERTASVSALTDLQLVALEGEAFQSFMEYNEDTEQELNSSAFQRKQNLDSMRDQLGVRQQAEGRFRRVEDLLNALS